MFNLFFKTDIDKIINIQEPQPLYNTTRYNMVLDHITLIIVGPQLVILDYFCYMSIHFTLVITQIGQLTQELAWSIGPQRQCYKEVVVYLESGK